MKYCSIFPATLAVFYFFVLVQHDFFYRKTLFSAIQVHIFPNIVIDRKNVQLTQKDLKSHKSPAMDINYKKERKKINLP